MYVGEDDTDYEDEKLEEDLAPWIVCPFSS